MTDRSHDPYVDLQKQPERGSREESVDDPADRRVPFVDGPTGMAPLASENRGDPDDEGDRGAETGAMGGVVAGTALAGPIGGVVGGLLGGTAGATTDDDAIVGDSGEVRDARLEAGEPTPVTEDR